MARILFALLALLCSSCDQGLSGEPVIITPPQDTTNPVKGNFTALTQALVNTNKLMNAVQFDTTFTITNGLTETDIRYTNRKGEPMAIYILKADLAGAGLSLETATANDQPDFRNQTVPDMARVVDKPGHRVVAGVNGDFYNITTLVPMGVLHKNGVAIKSTFSDNTAVPQQGLSFLGVLQNGELRIGYKSAYEELRGQLWHATGGGVLLVENGRIVDNPTFRSPDPRTAIGYTSSGTLYIIVADGRSASYSNGLTYEELSLMMHAFGVKDALNLDGGGSATCMIRNSASGTFEVRNRPADGAPRAVSNSWLIVSKQ